MFLCAPHGLILIRNMPSITVVSAIHPEGSELVMIGGVAFSYLFDGVLVAFDLLPFIGWPSVVAIALGSSIHYSYAL